MDVYVILSVTLFINCLVLAASLFISIERYKKIYQELQNERKVISCFDKSLMEESALNARFYRKYNSLRVVK